jgi:uncharacterized protein (TIGR03435 family)
MICALALLPSLAWPQAPPPEPAFEVASVKLTKHGRTADGWSESSIDNPTPGNFVATNASLDECVRWAYSIKEYQIAGPEWLKSDAASYDIVAKAPLTTPRSEIRRMLQTLLADRFKLALHRETRMLPVYHLAVAKGGSKLGAAGGGARNSTSSSGGTLEVKGTTMAIFAEALSRETGRPVFDKTGIAGAFDFRLEYAPENSVNSGRPSLFTVLQEQLGLKLEALKGPVEVLVIDHAERLPTAN